MVRKREAAKVREADQVGGGSPKRSYFNTRLREQARVALEAEARKNGRSLSEEIEARLESSLAHDAARRAFFGGAQLDNLFRLIAAVVNQIESRAGASWANDYAVHHTVKLAIARILDRVKPKPNGLLVALVETAKDLDPGPPPEAPPVSPMVAAMAGTGLLAKPLPADPVAAADEQANRDAAWVVYEEQSKAWHEKAARYQAILRASTEYIDSLERNAKETVDAITTLPPHKLPGG